MPTPPRIFFTALAALALLHPSGRAAETASPLTLYYTSAATKWTEALPIGNGRLGAMVFGGADREHLQLNEATLWAGGPYDPNNTNALAALPEARELIFDGKFDNAFTVVSQKMMAVPVREMPYETLGDLMHGNGTAFEMNLSKSHFSAPAPPQWTVRSSAHDQDRTGPTPASIDQ